MYAAKHVPRRLIPLLAAFSLAAAASASACILDRGPGSVEIPAEVMTSNAQYTLLYSTLGYDSAAAKHVLIRQNDVDAVPATGLAFHWRLADEEGRERASGLAEYAGTAWGIPLWVADLTDVDRAGEYRLLVDAPDVVLATPPFRIDEYLLSRTTLASVALDNAEQRAAPLEIDGGYYEGNSTDGSVAAHAQYLLGLIDVFDQRRFVLTAEQRERLQVSINRGIDYILLLTDPATGAIDRTSDRRGVGDDAYDTPEGLAALAGYARVFQREDSTRAQRAYRLAGLAAEWVKANTPQEYPPHLRASVMYDLYLYSNDAATLEETFAAARELAETYDVREDERDGLDGTAYFETLHRLSLDFPDHDDLPLWLEAAERNAEHYAAMLVDTPFAVVPPAHIVEGGPSPAEQWDASATTAPIPSGSEGNMSNEWFLGRARDAVYIARMTDDDSLYDIATGSLMWITGANPGIDSDFVPGDRSGSPFEAASFLLAAPGRVALGWDEWAFQRREPAGTILAGFRENFGYDDGFATGETSILRDGLWLRAIILYEDTLHASGAAAPPPEDAPRPPSDLVVTAEPLTGEGLTLAITVSDTSGAPVSGAAVTVAWSAARDGSLPANEGTVVSRCITTPEGACSASIETPDDSWARPITAAVTNVSHPRLRFEPSDALPAPFVFE